MTRCLLRMTGRSTPFGLFAGVAAAAVGVPPVVRWGAEHRPVVRAGGSWLVAVIGDLESSPALRRRLLSYSLSALSGWWARRANSPAMPWAAKLGLEQGRVQPGAVLERRDKGLGRTAVGVGVQRPSLAVPGERCDRAPSAPATSRMN